MAEQQVPTETPQSIFTINIIHPKNSCRLGKGLRPSRVKEIEATSLAEAKKGALAGETCSICGDPYEFYTHLSTAYLFLI